MLTDELVALLKQRNETVSFAESCTGGLLSGSITDISGASAVFLGAIVSYSNEVKENLLKVPHEDLQKYGAVSQEVAIKMAQGVQQALKSSWSVSITGVAGPKGGTPDKPVGTVWFCVHGSPHVKTSKQVFGGDRESIRKAAVTFALNFLKTTIEES